MLSGAMDMIVIKHPDGTLKATPLRVKFGSFKILNANEKEVEVIANQIKTEIKLRLSNTGDVYIPELVKKLMPRERANSNIEKDSCLSLAENDNTSVGESPLIPIKKESFTGEELNITSDVKSTTNSHTTDLDFEIPQKQVLIFEDLGNEYKELKNADVSDVSKIGQTTHNLKSSQEKDIKEGIDNESIMSEPSSRRNSVSIGITRENDFTIESIVPKINVELSNCWTLAQYSKNIEDDFYKNQVTYDEFIKDPWLHLNSKNLAFKLGENLYNWKAMAPILISYFAYDKQLPQELIEKLTEEEKGFLRKLFGSKTKNSNVVKIDVNKIHSPKRKYSVDNKGIEQSVNISNSKTIVKSFYKKGYNFSSEELKKLGLKDGKNELSFLVKSRLQGEQVLTSNVYLWDCNAKIVISDVDGTITRSDFLGHVLPLFGKDWTHKGIVELFNNIDKNGYKILYLSARALCQSKSTKSFINSITQENMNFPDGPVLLSPNSLTTSFKREVIDKTPQVFKISCLFEVLNLFPEDELPFYAGFGNRLSVSSVFNIIGFAKL